MTKILPFNFDIIASTDCWNSKFLGVILSDENNYNWYLESFIDIFLSVSSNGYYTGYYAWGSNAFNSMYNEVLSINPITRKENIVLVTMDSILNNKYVYLDVDYFFIPGSMSYKREHRTHDCIIMGYNEEKRKIYFTDFNINNKLFAMNEMSFEELSSAFYSALEINSKEYSAGIIGMPASTIFLKENIRIVNLPKILYELINYSMGEVRNIEHTYLKKYNADISMEKWDKFFKEWHGISVYDGYFDLLNLLYFTTKKMNDAEIISLTRFVESKKILQLKIDLFAKNDIIICDSTLIKDLKVLIEYLIEFKNLIVKHQYNGMERELSKAKECLKIAQELDIEITDVLIDLIYNKILEQNKGCI